MKKLFINLFIALTLMFFSYEISFAQSSTDIGWTIKEYNSEINIEKNQTVQVIENIVVDFGALQKHGIFRYVPYKYSRSGNNYNVRISVQSVTDKNNSPVNYEKTDESGNINIKIGDADKTVSGIQNYIIKYSIQRVINSFSDHDEFYWNVNGNDWPVPVEKISATIIWPDGAKITQNACFVGYFGSTDANCKIDASGNKVIIQSNRTLDSGENLTVVSGIEPGIIIKYTFWQNLAWLLADNWPYFIPIIVLILLIRNYLKNGRDPSGKTTIVPEFAPPDKLRPAVMGTLQDEKVDMNDISAVIIDFAVRGYIKIKEIENKGLFGIKSKDYEFTKTGKSINDLDDYEKEIFDGIFTSGDSTNLSDLKEKFYKHIATIKKDLYQKVTDLGYFSKNPNTTRNIYLGIGGAIVFGGFFIAPMIGAFTGSIASFMFAFIVSGIMILAFAFSMPKRTEKGVETTRQIKGFKLYMDTAEKYRQKFNEKEKIFEKFLPYAMVFGIVKEWAEKFKDMQLERPDWYEGRGAFYPVIFASSISNMQQSVNSTMVSAPSSAGSGGSGFSGGGSGGGFGGGGGGSW